MPLFIVFSRVLWFQRGRRPRKGIFDKVQIFNMFAVFFFWGGLAWVLKGLG